MSIEPTINAQTDSVVARMKASGITLDVIQANRIRNALRGAYLEGKNDLLIEQERERK